MARRRPSRTLTVHIGRQRVGFYTAAPSGATYFRYDDAWLESPQAFPISLALPLSDRQWQGAAVSHYFDGLLPDDQRVRETIAAREQAQSAQSFDLLEAIGRDCVGALRFVPEGSDPGDPREMRSEPISDDDIARKLNALGATPLGIDDEFRLSLAGVQEKTAFLRRDNRWHEPRGATPTSHIFKPSMQTEPSGADYSDSPWNEWLSLELCRAFGLDVARSEVQYFDGHPVLIVERFDRQWRDGILYRLPQEDICQALGVSPTRKYQSDGGPGIRAVMRLLESAIDPLADREAFLRAQLVFWLIDGIDGHAKNFSIFLTPGGFRLTPLYDVMSAAPFVDLDSKRIKLAMSVGRNRHYRVSEIQPRHFLQSAVQSHFRKERMQRVIEEVAQQAASACGHIEQLAADAKAPGRIADAIVSLVQVKLKRLTAPGG